MVDTVALRCYSVCIETDNEGYTMSFTDQAMKTARECGSYKAIAGMMAQRIRQLETAEAGTWEAEFAMSNLISLAQQFEETVERFEKEVDIA